jgi:DNA-binding SARP family transcriptional activator
MTAILQPRLGSDRGVIEVRMLGSLQVSRADGSLVEVHEWRTGKTADLLRILAMHAGDPVATHSLMAALWPNSDRPHAQASLRTAASQLRHVLGEGVVQRSLAGLRVTGIWVDLLALRALLSDARGAMRAGDLVAVQTIAREADLLYRGELRAHDDAADWVVTERRALAATYQTLQCDAAESAIALGNAAEGVDFAGRATTLDPFCERASRTLMHGYAATGNVSRALREYERCRALLAEELGVDPSLQTREVHLYLLRCG